MATRLKLPHQIRDRAALDFAIGLSDSQVHHWPVRNRPVGTVTFLFTDMEGSTRAWELHPAQTGALYMVADGTGGHVFASTLAVFGGLTPTGDALSSCTPVASRH